MIITSNNVEIITYESVEFEDNMYRRYSSKNWQVQIDDDQELGFALGEQE